MKPIHIVAKTISDAWFQLIYSIFTHSYLQTNRKDPHTREQYRLQYPGASVYIEYPHLDMVPVIPAGLCIPTTTTMECIENYFVNYLMDPELAENETYRYASRIHHTLPSGETQLDRVITLLKNSPLTNKAVIEIADLNDFDVCSSRDVKLDPPSLRLIDFKVIPMHGELVLTVSVYFRSWDLWTGFPTILGGVELLKQHVAFETGLKNGPMYAYSSGLHIYSYHEEIARTRVMKLYNRTNSSFEG